MQVNYCPALSRQMIIRDREFGKALIPSLKFMGICLTFQRWQFEHLFAREKNTYYMNVCFLDVEYWLNWTLF